MMTTSRWILLLTLVGSGGYPQVARTQQSGAVLPRSAAEQKALVDRYCAGCHSDRLRTGEVSLEGIDIADPPSHAETWEKVIRKLRTGAMPPQGLPRPDQAALNGLAGYLETSLDRAAAERPNPGRATVHRMNRTEYGNAIRDLLALEINAEPLLPADDESYGFDNIADVLKASPSLLERYMSASWNISRLAVGDPGMIADTTIYRAKPDSSQEGHMEGLPLGTRGGLAVDHYFPLDGEYLIRVRLWRATADIIKGLEEPHQVEMSIDGERALLKTIGGPDDRDLSYNNSGKSAEDIDQRLTARVMVKAGKHRVVATFLTDSEVIYDGALQPFLRTSFDPLDFRGMPAVDRVSINGPFHATGPGDTASRRKIFVCRPEAQAEELPCARRILSALGREAYRRPVNENDIETLLAFYQRGRNDGGTFERGVEAAIQLILASPEFLYRFEHDPGNLNPGEVYPLDDLQIASRLAFFLWSTIPDAELLRVAVEGRLKNPQVLEQQLHRMLADERSQALVDNFAGQWLYLRNLKNINPDFETFPDFDDNLRQAMKRETDLFIKSIVDEDRSVMDLLNADYTFLNERLARHYGIPKVYGTDFRRVTISDPNRRGLLGQASILTVTSLPTRTSPVNRGKWILTNVLGIPPTPPPPDVPALKEKSDPGNPTSLRERLELHRANTVCAGCHRSMDPIGFALENFDAVGQWRTRDEGVPIDPTGTLYEGTRVDSPASLRAMLTARPEIFTGVLTEKLLTYALGRGLQYYDMPAIRGVLREAAPSNYRFSSIVLGIVKSVPFRMKMKSPDEVVTAGIN